MVLESDYQELAGLRAALSLRLLVQEETDKEQPK